MSVGDRTKADWRDTPAGGRSYIYRSLVLLAVMVAVLVVVVVARAL